jgi:hypothetical protein
MNGDKDDRTKLIRLADALMDEIIATPDDEVVAEIGAAEVGRGRALLAAVKSNIARQLLVKAKAESDAWRSAQVNKLSTDRTSANEQFDRIRGTDPRFNQKMTLAARNGRAPTERDKQGLIDDWADLQRLEDEDKSE